MKCVLFVLLIACRATVPVVVETASVALVDAGAPERPVEVPARLQPKVFEETDTVVALSNERVGDAGVALSEQQVFPDEYSVEPGVFTFKGNPRRNGGAFGSIPEAPSALKVVWKQATLPGEAPWFGGSGWTGQAVVVKWPEVIRHSMTALGNSRFSKEPLTEVIQGSLDGHVHFFDLYTGRRTRKPIDTGNPIKGSVSLDPRAYPLLFVGQGIPQKKPIGLRVFNLISHEEVFFLSGKDELAPRKGWGAFDSSGLLNRNTDTYVVGGENGLVYLLKLNTVFDPMALSLSVNPQVLKYRYTDEKNEFLGVENSLSAFRNLIFFADNGGTIQSLDVRSMKPRWSFEAGDDTDASLALDLENEIPFIYTGTEVDKTGPAGNSVLRKINGLTGEVMWHREFKCTGAALPKKIDAGLFATPAIGTGNVSHLVFMTLSRCPGPENGLVVALEKTTGTTVWKKELPLFSWSSPLILVDEAQKRFVLQAGIGGVIRLLDATDGREVAHVKLEGDIESSPVVFDDRVVIGTRGGFVYGLQILNSIPNGNSK
jgi:outer membrane protein assembly factor BamB